MEGGLAVHVLFWSLYSGLIFYSLCNLVNLLGTFPLLLPFYAWKAVLTIFLPSTIDEGVPFERLELLCDDVRFLNIKPRAMENLK